MRTFLKALPLWLSFHVAASANAQDTIRMVDFNATKDSKRGGLPYDQEFKMKIRMPNAQPNYFVKLYAHKGKWSFTQSLKHDNDQNIVKHYMARLHFEPTMVKSDSVLTLHFKYDNKAPESTFLRRILRPFNSNSTILKPGRQYSLIINRAEEKNELVTLLQQSFNASGNVLAGQKAIYQIAFVDKFNNRSIQGISTLRLTDRDSIFDEYQEKIVPTDVKIAAKLTEFNNTITNKSATTIASAGIVLSYKYFSGEKPLNFIRCIDTCTLDKIIKQLHNMTDYAPNGKNHIYMWQWLYAGKATLLALAPQKDTTPTMGLPVDDYSMLAAKAGERATAINSTIASIQQYIVFLTNLEIALTDKHDQDTITSLKKALIAETKELQVGAKVLKDLDKLLKERDKLIVYAQRFASLTILDVNTHIYSFTTRNELMITPVFGYAYYGFQQGFSAFTPYLGFQVNLQAMNRDIPFKLITGKTLLQRFNFTTAWTLTPIGEKSKRFDLFANASSLLTGIGFKLGHVVSLNGGVIWFKKLNPNPVLTDKLITVTPFISVSINSEVSKLLGDFTKLIPAR